MMDFRELIKAGVHFGHIKARQCPKMLPYVWGVKNNVQLINVAETAHRAHEAALFLGKLASEGKQILWVGTKKPAQKVVADVAQAAGMPYVSHRWIGGTLSNYGQVKKSVTKLLHLQDIVSRAEKFPYYTKKELNTFNKMVQRLEKSVGGIRTLTWPVGALVVVDVLKEQSAIKEASMMGIPVVAIVDTNGDPSLVDYVIPANDDAVRSIEIIIQYIGKHVVDGVAVAAKNVADGLLKKDDAEHAAEHKPEMLDLHIPGFGSEDEFEAPAHDKTAKSGSRRSGDDSSNNGSRSRSGNGGRRRDSGQNSRGGDRKSAPKKHNE